MTTDASGPDGAAATTEQAPRLAFPDAYRRLIMLLLASLIFEAD